MCQVGIRDFPNFAEAGADRAARSLEFRARAGENRGGRCCGINLFRGGYKFGRGIIHHSTSVHDVGKNARHYFSPPFAATNSRTWSAFSSLLPWSISAPLPAAGTK